MDKRKTAPIPICVLLILLPLSVLAASKCIDDQGRIFYQDQPCPEHARGGEMSHNANRTFSGRALRPIQNSATLSQPDIRDATAAQNKPAAEKPSPIPEE